MNAAVPIALSKAIQNNKIDQGDLVVIYAAENTKWQHAILAVEF